MIGAKFVDNPPEEIVWPKLSSIPNSQPLDDAEKIESEAPLREYWSSIVPPLSASGPIDLSPLPPHWAVVSISITDDLSSMFVTRHQRDAAPVIFSMPFDRQSKRDVGDQEESLLFEEARSEMRDIIATSDDTSRNGRHVTSTEGRRQWWATRYGLDERLRVLLPNFLSPVASLPISGLTFSPFCPVKPMSRKPGLPNSASSCPKSSQPPCKAPG